MNYKILNTLLEKEDLKPKELWKFFEVETQDEMEKLIADNLKLAIMEPRDSFIYLAPKTLYESAMEIEHNIFYEKLISISFFLKGFVSYEDPMIDAFTRAVGIIKFIIIVEREFKDNEYFKFFMNSYKEYKHDKYFREQTSRMVELFESVAEGFEKIDLEEFKKVTKEIKEII